jgi:hypothetical protein
MSYSKVKDNPPSYEDINNTVNGSGSGDGGMHCRFCGPGNDNDHTLAELRAGICPRMNNTNGNYAASGPAMGAPVNISMENFGPNQTFVMREVRVFQPSPGLVSCMKWIAITVFVPSILVGIVIGIYSIATSKTHKFVPVAQYADYAIVAQFAKVSFASQFAYFSFISQISICSVVSMIR